MAAAAVPAAARTLIQEVAGDPASLLEPRWTVARDSPVVTSLAFLPWEIQVAPLRTSVARSSMVGAIILATRRPLDADLAVLRGRSFLTHYFSVMEASLILYHLDSVGAFDSIYTTCVAWTKALPALWSKLTTPGALCLCPALFLDAGSPARPATRGAAQGAAHVTHNAIIQHSSRREVTTLNVEWPAKASAFNAEGSSMPSLGPKH